jgi:hypothetical protein
VEVNANGKRSSLLRCGKNYVRESFIIPARDIVDLFSDAFQSAKARLKHQAYLKEREGDIFLYF